MTKYWVNGEECADRDDAWEMAEDLFWNCGDFEDFWEQEVDALQVFEELGRLGSPLYYELLDAIADRICDSIREEEVEDEEEEEEN